MKAESHRVSWEYGGCQFYVALQSALRWVGGELYLLMLFTSPGTLNGVEVRVSEELHYQAGRSSTSWDAEGDTPGVSCCVIALMRVVCS